MGLLHMKKENSQPLIPARMLNEFAYCPRLCYIEWIQGEFEDSADTVDGRYQHRRVDRKEGTVPHEDFDEFHAKSVYVSSENVGVTARIDYLEGQDGMVTPVDYKRGFAPDIPEGAYEPERVQLCAQGLVLRDNGFQCDRGIIYFVRSKKRVEIPLDHDLVARTLELIKDLRIAADIGVIPPPLEDSPKCPRCSLVGICLPDEINVLKGKSKEIRRLYPGRDDQVPVYVQGQGYSVHKKGDRIEIREKGKKLQSIPLREVSQLSAFGNVHITTPLLVELMQNTVPVLYFSYGGWFHGYSMGMPHKNVELRALQYSLASDKGSSLPLAKTFVYGKVKNCRTLLKRNDPDVPGEILERMADLVKKIEDLNEMSSLLGVEGAAAQAYFSRFDNMLKNDGEFGFENRNKRPPGDPVNAVLSYLYGVLVKECFVTLLSVGFDPYMGFYHQPKYGRPALALDMMEEFRPLIADSVTLTLFNNNEFQTDHFVRTGLGVSLTPDGKKVLLRGYERRMETEIKHPMFGYAVSYRRILEIQARLLSRYLSGEIEEYPPFCTR